MLFLLRKEKEIARIRKQYSAEFKHKVALAAIRGERTMAGRIKPTFWGSGFSNPKVGVLLRKRRCFFVHRETTGKICFRRGAYGKAP